MCGNKQEIVTIIFKSDSLLLCWLQKSKKEKVLRAKAWQKYTFDTLCINSKAMYNCSYLVACIRNFIQTHNLSQAYVSCGLSEEIVWEHYYWHEQDNHNADDFFSHASNSLWNYCVVSNNYHEKKNLLYAYGMQRSLLFQFQILALLVPFNCVFMSSVSRALLQVIFNNKELPRAFLYDQGLPCKEHYKKLIDSFEYTFLSNASAFHDFLQHEKESLYAAIGLFDLGKNYEQ